jgi:hypothetical protein
VHGAHAAEQEEPAQDGREPVLHSRLAPPRDGPDERPGGQHGEHAVGVADVHQRGHEQGDRDPQHQRGLVGGHQERAADSEERRRRIPAEEREDEAGAAAGTGGDGEP